MSFPVVVSTILNLFKESVEFNISTILPDLGAAPVTGAAFSLARYKIKLSFFKELNRILADFHKQCPAKLWRGYRLIAGDGSTVGLPPSKQIKEYFGVSSEKACGIKSCMAQVFMFYDVLSGAVIASRISKMLHSEKALLGQCLDELPLGRSIVILDRGFGHFHTCKRLYGLKQDFCIRISSSTSSFAKRIMEMDGDDLLVEWKASEKERRTCLEHGLDTENIRVRATKVTLGTGEIELLVSSLLDMNDIPTASIRVLYNLRWPVEEGFKRLKPKMKLEHFGCRKPEGVFQEFEAHIFMMNLVALMGIQAQQEIIKKCKNRKLEYRYNWQNAFRFVRSMLVKILNTANPSEIIKALVKLISSSKIPIKPDRTFPRTVNKKRKSRLYQTYK